MLKNLLLAIPLLILTACCPSKSSITLLPDSDGGIGAVDITLTEENNTQVSIEKPFQSVEIKNNSHTVANLSEEEIAESFPELSKSDINMDNKFPLYFDSSQDKLSAKEFKKISTIIANIENDTKSDILVIGYADATGNSQYNLQLSKNRATNIADVIKKQLSFDKEITVKYHGDTRAKIDSQSGMEKAKSRRVDVIFY